MTKKQIRSQIELISTEYESNRNYYELLAKRTNSSVITNLLKENRIVYNYNLINLAGVLI